MPCRFISYDAGAAIEVSCLLYLRFLAFWTEVRRSLRHQHSPDRCAAIHTWFAGALVHAVAKLKEPLAALGGQKGPKGKTPPPRWLPSAPPPCRRRAAAHAPLAAAKPPPWGGCRRETAPRRRKCCRPPARKPGSAATP